MNKRPGRLAVLSLAVLGTGFSIVQPATADPDKTQWNLSSDPHAPYGFCHPGGSAMRERMEPAVHQVGKSAANILAITMLQCNPYSGGGSVLVACPAGSPYAYCTHVGNDGAGNDVTFGIVSRDANNDPNSDYSGCPVGAQVQPKIDLLRTVRDPRRIDGLVTLACGPATQPATTEATLVACPAGPHPYSVCIQTPNDGLGNSVTLGVIGANGASDPYALYGECHNTFAGGVQPGFMSKSTIVEAVGLSLDHVRGIDMLGCNQPAGMGYPPSNPTIVPCSTVYAGPASHYDYCVFGVDDHGNALAAGVITGS